MYRLKLRTQTSNGKQHERLYTALDFELISQKCTVAAVNNPHAIAWRMWEITDAGKCISLEIGTRKNTRQSKADIVRDGEVFDIEPEVPEIFATP